MQQNETDMLDQVNDAVRRIAMLAAQSERSACALVCEEMAEAPTLDPAARNILVLAAKMIRGRK